MEGRAEKGLRDRIGDRMANSASAMGLYWWVDVHAHSANPVRAVLDIVRCVLYDGG